MKHFEKIVRKGENIGNQHFLPFPPFRTNFSFSASFILSSTNALILDQSKILSFGKELTIQQTTAVFINLLKRDFKSIFSFIHNVH